MEILQKMLFFEVWIFIFGGSLAENARIPQSHFKKVAAAAASNMLQQSPLQKCYRSHCFMTVKNVTALTASRMLNVTAIAAPTMLPQSPLQECYRSRRFKKEEGYHTHRFKNATALTASRMLPKSPLQQSYRSHRFKNVTAVAASNVTAAAVIASRMLLCSLYQQCYQGHGLYTVTAVSTYKNLTEAMGSRRF